jgi:uncharacterized membrane protein YbaN (DUF454 family)
MSIRRLALGWILLVLGVAGLLLPLLPGIPLLIVGLFVLSGEQQWARRVLTRARQRFPNIADKAQQIWRRAGLEYRRRFSHQV